MNDRCLLAVLGSEKSLISRVLDKLSSSKPVDAYFCIDLKDFLIKTIENPPDIVAVSMNYQHKNVVKFPKLFKMALNAPVIIFTEKQDPHFQRLLNAAQSDYKISGKLNPHNLWFKINSILNHLENEANNSQLIPQKDKNTPHLFEKKAGPMILRGFGQSSPKKDTGSVLTQLFAALNDESDKEIETLEDYIPSQSQREKESFYYDPSNNQGSSTSDVFHDENKSSVESVGPEDLSQLFGEENEGNQDLENTEQNSSEIQPLKSLHPLEQMSTENNESEEADLLKGSFKTKNHLTTEDEENRSGQNSLDAKSRSKKKKTFSETDENKKSGFNGFDKSGAPKTQPVMEEDTLDPRKNSDDNHRGQTLDQEENDKFGSVKLDEENEQKNRELKKDKKKREDLKRKNALKESCDEALREIFFSKNLSQPRPFESKDVHVFIVEMAEYKGFLMINNSFNHNIEAHILSEFRTLVLENLKKKGVSANISNEFYITAELSDYGSVVSQFSEFVLYHEEETGKQQVVSFVKREVVQPKISESDKEGMYLIDLKVIPPQTLVNFDAFIYLPKNNRFVRYLKNGRSLSLSQAKRHSEENDNTNLYLPKADKNKFIQFFIQNTISWELEIYKNSVRKETA